MRTGFGGIRGSLMLVMGILVTVHGMAPAQTHSEYEVKAALLTRVVKVVEWPADTFTSPDDTLHVGVIDPDPFEGALARAYESTTAADGRPVRVRTVSTIDSAEDLHVLFVPSTSTFEVDELARSARARGILVVGETRGFVENDGGILALVLEGKRTRMVLNVDTLATSGLQASSQFLRLCVIVGDRARR